MYQSGSVVNDFTAHERLSNTNFHTKNSTHLRTFRPFTSTYTFWIKTYGWQVYVLISGGFALTVYASLSLVNYYYVKWWIYSHTDSTPLATNGQITDAEWKIYERFFRWFYISNPNFQNSNNIEILLSENARLKQLRKSTSNNNNYSNFIWVLRDRYLQSVQEIKQYEQAKSTEKFEVLTKSFNKKAQENVQKYQQNQEKYIRLINLQYKVSKKCLHNYQEQVSLIFNCKHM